MARQKLNEAILILRAIESQHVQALYDLSQNKKVYEPLVGLLGQIKNTDMKKILDKAGGVSSMDSLIDNSVEQSFRRGRISALVLLQALLINAEAEMERRERQSKK